MEDYRDDLETLKPFLPNGEYKSLEYFIRPGQEERDGIGEIIRAWNKAIAEMPRTYDQDGKGDSAMVYLHYFIGGSDWYITELDKEGTGTEQAFGFAILNGDTEMAELGYISIDELKEVGAELDLYFDACTLAEVKTKHGIMARVM